MSTDMESTAAETKTTTGRWRETAAGIWYTVGDSVEFEDDLGHWRHGFCRLLELPEERAKRYIAFAVETARDLFGVLPSSLAAEDKITALAEASRRFFQPPGAAAHVPPFSPSWGTSFRGKPADTVYAASISGNCERMIIGSSEDEFAWQVSARDEQPVAASSVVYDRSYYESPGQAHCGMRDYIHHDDWRIEKARRLMRNVVTAAGKRATRWLSSPGQATTLDVGSATGYFRKAMDELGFRHFGVDLSRDAIALCRETYNYETWEGTLFDLPAVAPDFKGSFTIITMWDTIEHLDDPLAAAKLLREFLAEDGVLVIRTPSLTAFERDVLGDMYYSFKLDHVRYFSPRSLTAMMSMAGLEEQYMETTSHLFKGYLGATCLFRAGEELRGADIVALYSR